MTFKKRFIFLPFLALLIGFLFYSVYQEVKEQTISEFNEQQMTIATQTAQGIEKLFENYYMQVFYLSTSREIIDFSNDGKEKIKRYYKSHELILKAITRVDAQGKIVYTYPYNKNAIGADISKQEHMIEILATHEPVVSDVFFAVQNYETVAYHLPVMDKNEFKGTLAFLIPFSNIANEYLSKIRLKENGYAWLISEKGIKLYCPNNEHIGKSIFETAKNLSSVIETANKMIRGEEGTTYYVSFTEKTNTSSDFKMHAAYCPIILANTHWSICVATPEDEVLAAMTGFRNKLILIILAIAIIGMVFTYYFIKAWIVLIEEKKRKKAELALKESEKKFRELSDLLPQIIYETDIHGKLTFVNKKAYEYFGYTKQEFEDGLVSTDMLIPEQRQLAVENFRKALYGEEQGSNEYIAQRKDGSTFSGTYIFEFDNCK